MNLQRLAVLAAGVFAGYAAFAWYAVRRLEDLEPESAGAPGTFIDIDGVRVHYVEAGQGEAVVLVHGWNGSTFGFRHIIPELAQHFRVVAPDLKGFGYSARPARSDYSLSAQADLVRAFMRRLGIERAALVGHSMGGGVAMTLALRYPASVSRLVLVDSVTAREQRRGLRLGLLLRPLLPLMAAVGMRRSVVRRALRAVVHDPASATPEAVEAHFRPLRMKGHLRAMGRQLVDRGRDAPLEPERISQPTLILWGEHDRVIPIATGDELAVRIPNARLVRIRSAGHLPLEEQPESSNAALLRFLQEGPEPAPVPRAAGLETPA